LARYERTAHVSVSPDDVFDYLSDPRNLPACAGLVRVDDRARRIEWRLAGAIDGGGAIDVAEEAIGALLTLELHTGALEDDGAAKGLERALACLARALEERGSARR
jgi:hypothetical protein